MKDRYLFRGNRVDIKLNNGLIAIIDEDDYEKVKDITWYADYCKNVKSFYVKTAKCKLREKTSLHRFIVNPPKHMFVDHVNHNTLDNRKSNLRIVTRSQNQMNQKKRCDNLSGYTGVGFIKDEKKWQARITVNQKTKRLGRFFLKCQAVKARKEAEQKHFGEYSYESSINV